MNITKELLNHLQVNTIFITYENVDYQCFFIKKVLKNWVLKLPDFDTKFIIGNQVKINVLFEDKIVESVNARITDFGVDYCVAELNQVSGSEKIAKILSRLNELESRDELFGRRKEKRIKVGVKNWEIFGLSGPEQMVYIPSLKIQLPCAIYDVSIHGICIVTVFSPSTIKFFDNFNIIVTFAKPEFTKVTLQAHKVHIRLNRVGDKIFASLSCQLLEPINFLWKEKVIELITQLSLSYNSCIER